MSEPTATAVPSYLAHHFESLEKQTHAARLGMWLFLATEILLFTALFTGYAVYRYLFTPDFQAASRDLATWIGISGGFVQPGRALLSRKLKIKGNPMTLAKLPGVFQSP